MGILIGDKESWGKGIATETTNLKLALVKIEVDGGVNTQNAKKLLECGADVLVAGSFVFTSGDPLKTIAALKNCSPIEVN